MDNLDKIKFKQSVPGWLIKIDNSGKTEFKEGTRYVNELQAWKDAGNEIEPQFTTEEQAAKDQKEAAQLFDGQKAECIRLLDESEIHVSTDPPYPDDSQDWKSSRAQWRAILRGSQLAEIPEKPF